MNGGAWPFLVGGVICLVNSVNERDLDLQTRFAHPRMGAIFFEGLFMHNKRRFKAITGL